MADNINLSAVSIQNNSITTYRPCISTVSIKKSGPAIADRYLPEFNFLPGYVVPNILKYYNQLPMKASFTFGLLLNFFLLRFTFQL